MLLIFDPNCLSVVPENYVTDLAECLCLQNVELVVTHKSQEMKQNYAFGEEKAE